MRLKTLTRLAFLLAASPCLAEQPVPSFPADTSLVTVDLVVSDSRGRSVPGLTRDDFVVREDGRMQEITVFEAVERAAASGGAPETARTELAPATPRLELPRSEAAPPMLVFVFDEPHLSPAGLQRARRRLGDVLGRASFGNVDLYLISSERRGGYRLSLPADREGLTPALARFRGRLASAAGGGMNDQEAFQIAARRQERTLAQVYRRYLELGLLPGGSSGDASKQRGGGDWDFMAASEVTIPGHGRAALRAEAELRWSDAQRRRAATLRGLTGLTRALGARRERKAIVLVSEGFVDDPAQPEQRELIEAARLAHAGIHLFDVGDRNPAYSHSVEWADTVDLRDVHETNARAAEAASGARAVALATGGRIVRDSSGVAEALDRLAGSLRVYYVVGYSPQQQPDGRFHEIKVEVRRTGLAVEARPGYYAVVSRGATADDRPGDIAASARAVALALDSPVDASDLPLRLAAYVMSSKGGRSRVRVVAELAEPATGPVDAVLRLTARGRHETEERTFEGTSAANTDPPLRLEGDFEAAPGAYQAQVVLRERASGRLGGARRSLEVLPDKAFRTSTLLLTDTVVGDPPNVSPVPHADRRFAQGKALYCFVEVGGASPGFPVLAGLDLLDAAGRVRLRVSPSPLAAGQRSRLWSLPLAGLEPGPYEALLNVQDTRTRQGLQRREPFEVVVER